MHALLPAEIVDHRRVLARKGLETLFAPGIGEASAVENESAAVAGFVFWQPSVKREAENSHGEILCGTDQFRLGWQGAQLFRIHHAFEGAHQGGQRDGQLHMLEQPTQALQRVRHALQKMSSLLIKAAKAISAQGLHEADVHEGVVIVHKSVAPEVDESREPVEISIEQLLPQLGRKVGLGIKQKRGDIVF